MTVVRESAKLPDVSGLIPVFKPTGLTSKDVSRLIMKRFGRLKIGHVGTLDPDADGVLPILIGRGTKLQDYLLKTPKAYSFELTLGSFTDTMDASGTVLLSRPWEHVTKDAVAAVLGSFLGPLRQIPPAFSAVKYRGKELYKYARAGKTAEDLPLEDLQRDIEIYSLAMEYIEGPRIGLTVHCSKGTYVRVLATDIAKLLNTAGHVTRLTRIESAGFSIGECVTVEHLGEPAVTLESLVIPIDRLSIGLPTWVSNDMVMLQRIVDGQVVVVDLQSVNDGLDADKPFDILAKTADGRSIGIVEATPILGRNAKLHMKRGL